ncbi:MAG: PDDEXK nuclease domain-containing protein [Candidatus Thermoplasmatota archaeon]|nr:PDDEXK nuclease domain-containing protein [Candidatus Thermoplasmatota archaeon]
MTLSSLIESIRLVHEQLSAQAKRAVNISLTLRNWAIGYYIREYEQNGFDRARYGARICERIAQDLQKSLDRCYSGRYLRLCRQFYDVYPQIGKSQVFRYDLPSIGKSPISEFEESHEKGSKDIGQSTIPPDILIERISFTHFVELLAIEDDMKRAFYEVECIRGVWSVRELGRQISSLYFERCGLSKNKEKLAEIIQKNVEHDAPALAIRDPYVFEFLGLKPKEVMDESAMEDEILDKLQDFLLELGTGFCFEAQQKRILIGNTYGFVDLVFYHRLLKCHVLVELKRSKFTHEDIGQLNTYVSWYKGNVMAEGDNPPVGILLCTGKDHTLVEYALAGMNNNLFVSKYQLELPSKEDIQRFFKKQMETILMEQTISTGTKRKEKEKGKSSGKGVRS